MLATLGVHEDWGLSKLGKRGRMPISWIFMLASVSAGETTQDEPELCSYVPCFQSSWWLVFNAESILFFLFDLVVVMWDCLRIIF